MRGALEKERMSERKKGNVIKIRKKKQKKRNEGNWDWERKLGKGK